MEDLVPLGYRVLRITPILHAKRSIASANADAYDLRYRSDAKKDRAGARPVPDAADFMIAKDLVRLAVPDPS